MRKKVNIHALVVFCRIRSISIDCAKAICQCSVFNSYIPYHALNHMTVIGQVSVWLKVTYLNAQRPADSQMLAVEALCLTNISTILISLSDSCSVEADPKMSKLAPD